MGQERHFNGTGVDLTAKYDEIYFSGVDYDYMRLKALGYARKCLDAGDITTAEYYLGKSEKYNKVSDMNFKPHRTSTW